MLHYTVTQLCFNVGLPRSSTSCEAQNASDDQNPRNNAAWSWGCRCGFRRTDSPQAPSLHDEEKCATQSHISAKEICHSNGGAPEVPDSLVYAMRSEGG